MYHLGLRLKKRAAETSSPRNVGLNALTWQYQTEGPHDEPVAEEILAEINGFNTSNREQLSGYKELKNDGGTACGCWIYSGVMPSRDQNKALKREPTGRYGQGWGYAWPSDRRILYNRASARPNGEPWSERKKLIWWNKDEKKWTGLDVPDFTETKAPDYKPGRDAKGDDGIAGDKPFIMHQDGVGWIWVSSGLKDGPLPTHYEPLESVSANPLYPNRSSSPVADKKERSDNVYAFANDQRFPYILSTYRLTEHHTAGGMSRTLPHLAELQPELFAEISPELAAELKIEHGGYLLISTMRGLIEARALITERIKPLVIDGKIVHQVCIPYHFGYKGLVRGDTVNDLLAISEEPNVRIMETKALVCNVKAGRIPHDGNDLKIWRQELKRPA
jgi:formate dehydrogenase major subunit